MISNLQQLKDEARGKWETKAEEFSYKDIDEIVERTRQKTLQEVEEGLKGNTPIDSRMFKDEEDFARGRNTYRAHVLELLEALRSKTLEE